MKNLGVIQGRLSCPNEGFQECPINWQREFDLLPEIGLSHIEWIITSSNYHQNPIFKCNLKGYPISSLCADFMVHTNFKQYDYLESFLVPLCQAAASNAINCITIPLLEASDVSKIDDLNSFIDSFSNIVKQFPSLTFLIEAELDVSKLKKILDISPEIMVTYDTGNITSCKLDHQHYINNLSGRILQVHLKDRTINPINTVVPGKGDTDFNLIFASLKNTNFNGLYTLQTARENNGNEINTISKHKNFLTSLYNE